MAARTTATKVQQVIDVDCSVNLQPYIRPATALTDYVEEKDTEGVLTTSLLNEIETHLAAHFYQAHLDKQYASKNTGRAGATFQGKTEMVLLSTDPGQTACLLDVTGTLAQLSAQAASGMKKTARVTWAGTAADSPRPDQTVL